MHINWIDWILLVVFGYALIDGWERGFFSLLIGLISLLGSLWFAVRYHTMVGNFFVHTFGLTTTWKDVMGYLVVAIVTQIAIEMVCVALFRRLPESLRESKTNTWMGSVVSLVNTLVITAFVLLLILKLPFRGTIKTDIKNSVISSVLTRLAEQYGGQWNSAVNDIAQNTTKFLTVEPGSQQRVPLDIGTPDTLSVDTADEQAMVTLVNHERTSRGIAPLSVNEQITKVAEAKSRDMFTRKYFSHYDPDGKNVADHMKDAGISYTVVGENLAYAPDLATAHQGLMNSAGHRANILDTHYHKIGIGVIDGGIYGKMFTQEFTD